MRTWATLGLALLLATSAGCFGGKDGGDDGRDGTAPPSGGYVLDCLIGGNGWIEPCLALASPNDSPSKAEIDLVVNPLDPLNVVVASKDLDPVASPCVWAVVQVTKDGGHTWRTNYIGGPEAERPPTSPLYGYECITDPILTFNRDGDLFYNLQAYQQQAEGIVPGGLPMGADVAMMALAISHDGGESWPEIIPEFFGDDLTVFPDYMRMGTNPQTGSVFAQWNTIVGLAASQPTLVTYRPGVPAPVTQPWFFVTPDQPTGLGESSVIGANDGTIYSVLGGFNSPEVVYMATSNDDGQTFSVPTFQFGFTAMDGSLEGTEFRTGTAVEVAIDTSGGANDGCLYAAWADAAQDAADILSRHSCDGGATWTEPVLVSSGPHEDAQFFPRVSVDGRGAIHVVYLTRAYDPAHHLVDGEWAVSTDGGATWTATRLTQHSFDGDLGIHQNGFPFLGDYIGIGSSGDHTYMGFPSTVTGRAEIAVAHVQFAATT
jgi:hypothetical protein